MARPTLDHLVIDVREHLDDATRIYRGLGFHLIPRGHHTLGATNTLAVFDTNYLELLGFGKDGATRPELPPFPTGLNGLVFRAQDAGEIQAAAQAKGLLQAAVQGFSALIVET